MPKKPVHNLPAANGNNGYGTINGNSGGGELYEKVKQQKQNKESDYIMNGNPTIVPPAHMNNAGSSPVPPPPSSGQTNGNGAPAVMGAHPSEDVIGGNKDYEVSLGALERILDDHTEETILG